MYLDKGCTEMLCIKCTYVHEDTTNAVTTIETEEALASPIFRQIYIKIELIIHSTPSHALFDSLILTSMK